MKVAVALAAVVVVVFVVVLLVVVEEVVLTTFEVVVGLGACEVEGETLAEAEGEGELVGVT